MEVVLVAAVAANGVIGDSGGLPWHYPEDLKHFKEVTMGHPVIMGRKTFDGIVEQLGEALPGRTNVVLTRHGISSEQEEVCEAGSVDEALRIAEGADGRSAYVVGGGSVYDQFLNQGVADRLLITHIPEAYDGDTRWPGTDFGELDRVDQYDLGEGLTVATYDLE